MRQVLVPFVGKKDGADLPQRLRMTVYLSNIFLQETTSTRAVHDCHLGVQDDAAKC